MLPSHPTLTGTNRADEYDSVTDSQCLGLVRLLGVAASHSVNLTRGGRPRLIAHSHDIGGPVSVWYHSVESIEALDNYYLFQTIDIKSWKTQDTEIPCKIINFP